MGSILLLFPKRKLASTCIVVAFFLISIKSSRDKTNSNSDVNLEVLHTSEGVLGQVKVIDFGWKTGEEFTQARAVLVNNTWQTAVSMETGISLLSYVYHLLPVIELYPRNSQMLVVGLGGGGLIREMQASGYSPDVIELDGRLPKLAQEYFGLEPRGEMIVDDGRHFINTTQEKYDVVILDVFQGEVAPWQLLTLEAFQEVKRVLNANGLLAIEFFGNTKNAEESKALSAVVKTLGKVGFNIQIIDVAEREKLILASKGKPLNLEQVGFRGKYYEEKDISDLSRWLVSIDRLDTSRVPLLTDNLPVLEKMTLKSAKEWRQYQNQMFRDYFVEFGLSNIH